MFNYFNVMHDNNIICILRQKHCSDSIGRDAIENCIINSIKFKQALPSTTYIDANDFDGFLNKIGITPY